MNKTEALFQNGKNKILSIYFTAGYPNLNSMGTILNSLEQSGADLVEIGIPFSDPVADGPIIQESSQLALQNGMTLEKLFAQLQTARPKIQLPILLMGYLNPILQFGIERFCQECNRCNIDGVIIPDLPLAEYQANFKKTYRKYRLNPIFLITPQTPTARIKELAQESSPFLYMVSTSTTTGSAVNIEMHGKYYKRISKITSKPLLIGFGIDCHQSFSDACRYAQGAVIGSAFIKTLKNSSNLYPTISTFIEQIRNGKHA